MTAPKDPELIDLARYKKAVQDGSRARAKDRETQAKIARRAGRPVTRGKEPLLGSRPGAGLILLLAGLVAAALWMGPRLF